MAIQKETLTFILAGGMGSRLSPLTDNRTKPAVPFGGKYRIIDFTLTNCLHSELRRILVLTQYKSHSLQKHLRDGWSIFNPEMGDYITPVPAQMRKGENWYQGTADAIYQNLYIIKRSGAKYILILSGDHIYRMDYAELLKTHVENDAALTVACMEVDKNEARAFGVMQINDEARITAFQEKPADPITLPDDDTRSLASMGIYVFSVDLLMKTLEEDNHKSDSSHDFGKDIIPSLIENQRVYAHRFGSTKGRVSPDRYWRDVGTIDSYYNANMDLLKTVPPLNLYQNDWPIRSYQAQTPPARAVPGGSGTEGIFINSILAGGAVVAGGSVSHSILFQDVFVDDEALVQDSLIFQGVHIGINAKIKNAIIDKHVKVPPGEHIGFDLVYDRQRFTVSEQGIVVVPQYFQFE